MDEYVSLEALLQAVRKAPAYGELRRSQLSPDPFEQFAHWFQEVLGKERSKANVMVLATASKRARPSARCVLLHGIDAGGFVFFTNSESRKGRELKENPYASAVLYWPSAARQVVLRGSVEKLQKKETELHFRTSPRNAQLAAWCCKQDQIIKDRGELEAKFSAAESRFLNGNIPLTTDWNGYRLRPDAFEFWQGRKNLLNDRFRYTRKQKGGRWEIERLEP